jgi:hypothetical protein
MTEDDTFRILKRIPINEMVRIISDEYTEISSANELLEIFLNKHGWTLADYLNAFDEYIGI